MVRMPQAQASRRLAQRARAAYTERSSGPILLFPAEPQQVSQAGASPQGPSPQLERSQQPLSPYQAQPKARQDPHFRNRKALKEQVPRL